MHRPTTVVAAIAASVVVGLLAGVLAPSHVHSAGPQTTRGGEERLVVAALGDSFTSGEGVEPYLDATRCHRSRAAWPARLTLNGVTARARNFACSGARTTALTTSFKGRLPQLRALRQAVTRADVDVVTLTMGGNDVEFARTLTACVLEVACERGGGPLDRAHRRITVLGDQIGADYRAVRAAAGGAPVVVVGYPRLFPAGNDDEDCLWLTDAERDGLNSLARRLNATLRDAADLRGLSYIPQLATLAGHELCTDRPWLFPVDGISGQRQAHPTGRGLAAIAAVVTERLPRVLTPLTPP
jgi:lysophospholipase L1-like esterase